jgi:hypothetical protein
MELRNKETAGIMRWLGPLVMTQENGSTKPYFWFKIVGEYGTLDPWFLTNPKVAFGLEKNMPEVCYLGVVLGYLVALTDSPPEKSTGP